MNSPLFLVVCGDASADVHASSLIRALKRREPGARVAACGGPLCRAEADEFLEDIVSRNLGGFWEPAMNAAFLVKLGRRLGRFLAERKPAALICADFYGFNSRLLPLAFDAGVPAYWFVSPQVWASRPGRVKTLKRYVKKIMVIFPFEEEIYRRAGMDVEFVGHPLLDSMPEPEERARDFAAPAIGILPGSRTSELERHIPVFYEAFARVRARRPNARGFIFASPNQPDEAYHPLPQGAELAREGDFARRRTLDLALCSSGTATLENALLGVPMVVAYKVSWATYAIGRALISVKHVAMPNVLAGRGVVPELLQGAATPERLAQELGRLLDDPARAEKMRGELLALRKALGERGACERAAAAVLSGLGQGARA